MIADCNVIYEGSLSPFKYCFEFVASWPAALIQQHGSAFFRCYLHFSLSLDSSILCFSFRSAQAAQIALKVRIMLFAVVLLVFSSSYLIANISSLTIAFFPIFSCELFCFKTFLFYYISRDRVYKFSMFKLL